MFRRMISGIVSLSIVLTAGAGLVIADQTYTIENSTYYDIWINGQQVSDGESYTVGECNVTIEAQIPFYMETTDGSDVVDIAGGSKDQGDEYVYTISNLRVNSNLIVEEAGLNYVSVNNADDFIQVVSFINEGGFGNGEAGGIFLTDDVTLPYIERAMPFILNLTKDIKINLNGMTLDTTDRWLNFTAGAKALIQNGTVKLKEHSITVVEGASLDILNATVSSYEHCRVLSVKEGSSAVISDSVIEMDSYMTQDIISVDGGSLTVNSENDGTFIRFDDDNSHSGLIISAGFGASVNINGGYFSKDISRILPATSYVIDEGQVTGQPYHKWSVHKYDCTSLTMADGVEAEYTDHSEFDPDNVIVDKEFTLTSDELFVLVTGDSDLHGVLDDETGIYSMTVSLTEPAFIVVPGIRPGDYFRCVRPGESGSSDHVNANAGTWFLGINDQGGSEPIQLKSDLPELTASGNNYAAGNVKLDVEMNDYGCGIRLLYGYGTLRNPYVFGEIRTYSFRDYPAQSDRAFVSEFRTGDRLEHYPSISADVVSVGPHGALLESDHMFSAVTGNGDYASELSDRGKYTALIPLSEVITDLVYRPYNKLEGYSLSLDGSIGVNFYMSLEDSLAEDTQAYMLFTLPNGTTERVYLNPLEGEARKVATRETVDGKQYYAFQCHVSAKEVHDEINAVFISGDMRSDTFEFSVEDYTDVLMSSEYAHLGLHDFAEAMMVYGMASDYYFGYYIEDMSSWDTFMAYACGKYDSIPDLQLPDSYDESDLPSNVKFEGTSLVLKSETKLKLYMKSDDDITAYVGGVSVPVTRNGKYQIVELTGINALALNDDITVRIAAGNEIGDVTVNPMVYCSRILEGSYKDELKVLIKALVYYNYQAELALQ